MAIIETEGRTLNLSKGKFYSLHTLLHSRGHLVFEEKGLGPRSVDLEVPSKPQTARRHCHGNRAHSQSSYVPTRGHKRRIHVEHQAPPNLKPEQIQNAMCSNEPLRFGVRKGYMLPAERLGKSSEAGGTRRILKPVNETCEQRAMQYLMHHQNQPAAQSEAAKQRISTALECGGLTAIDAADSLKRSIQSEQCRADLSRMKQPQRCRSADYLMNGTIKTPYAVCRNESDEPVGPSKRYYRSSPLPTAVLENKDYDIISQFQNNKESQSNRGILGRFSKRPASFIPCTRTGSANGQIPYDTDRSVPYPDPPKCGVPSASKRPIRRPVSPNRSTADHDTLNAMRATAKSAQLRASSPCNPSRGMYEGIPEFMCSAYVSSPTDSGTSDIPTGRGTFSRRKLHDTSINNPLSMNQRAVSADARAPSSDFCTGKRVSPMKYRSSGSIY